MQLPVLSMDISDDSKLIVTCSADKNVKIWGLDFGDCHKSIFAHEESVMQVAFEKGSHYFWTVGKDKMLKYWDGDKVRVCLLPTQYRTQARFISLVREHTKIRGAPR
jgi:WD40 repeat protein